MIDLLTILNIVSIISNVGILEKYEKNAIILKNIKLFKTLVCLSCRKEVRKV
mgnify:FL=1